MPKAPRDGPMPRMSSLLLVLPSTMNPAMRTLSPASTRMRVEMLARCEPGMGVGVGVAFGVEVGEAIGVGVELEAGVGVGVEPGGGVGVAPGVDVGVGVADRKSTRLNS